MRGDKLSDKMFFEGSKNPLNIFRSAAFDIRFIRSNPQYFDPSGIWLYVGCQGSGKTLSACQTVQKLADLYPRAVVCSNLDIYGIAQDVIPFTDYSQIHTINNGIFGVIYLIDEIPVLWNSLESKNIPVSEMATFCQMRKERRVIIGTAQVYNRVAKPIREQLKYVIKCRSLLKYIQINQLIDPNADGYSGEHDGEMEGELLKTFVWFHHPNNYQSYDTLNKINRLERNEKQKRGIFHG